MFQKLVHDWKEERGMEPRQVAEKVKKFFAFYVSFRVVVAATSHEQAMHANRTTRPSTATR